MHPAKPTPAPQHFTASLAAESPFVPKGLRAFWEYRDLGIAAATGGAWKATVLRANRPCPPGGTGWHRHALDFQFYLLLQGTMRTQVHGQGELHFGPGDSFMQPPHTWHNVVHFSDDLELLELVAPAEIGTEESEPGAGPDLAADGAQAFTVSTADDTPFESGLRAYFAYRDLGTRAGSRGLVQAHVLRAVKPCPPDGTGWHRHDVDFQMVYVLKGRITTALEGQGERTFVAGDAWLQPPGIRHCVMAYSAGLEMVEILSPADFGTEETEAPE